MPTCSRRQPRRQEQRCDTYGCTLRGAHVVQPGVANASGAPTGPSRQGVAGGWSLRCAALHCAMLRRAHLSHHVHLLVMREVDALQVGGGGVGGAVNLLGLDLQPQPRELVEVACSRGTAAPRATLSDGTCIHPPALPRHLVRPQSAAAAAPLPEAALQTALCTHRRGSWCCCWSQTRAACPADNKRRCGRGSARRLGNSARAGPCQLSGAAQRRMCVGRWRPAAASQVYCTNVVTAASSQRQDPPAPTISRSMSSVSGTPSITLSPRQMTPSQSKMKQSTLSRMARLASRVARWAAGRRGGGEEWGGRRRSGGGGSGGSTAAAALVYHSQARLCSFMSVCEQLLHLLSRPQAQTLTLGSPVARLRHHGHCALTPLCLGGRPDARCPLRAANALPLLRRTSRWRRSTPRHNSGAAG